MYRNIATYPPLSTHELHFLKKVQQEGSTMTRERFEEILKEENCMSVGTILKEVIANIEGVIMTMGAKTHIIYGEGMMTQLMDSITQNEIILIIGGQRAQHPVVKIASIEGIRQVMEQRRKKDSWELWLAYKILHRFPLAEPLRGYPRIWDKWKTWIEEITGQQIHVDTIGDETYIRREELEKLEKMIEEGADRIGGGSIMPMFTRGILKRIKKARECGGHLRIWEA